MDTQKSTEWFNRDEFQLHGWHKTGLWVCYHLTNFLYFLRMDWLIVELFEPIMVRLFCSEHPDFKYLYYEHAPDK